MSQRPKILFFSEAASLAHIVRPLVLANSLPPESFNVVLAAPRDDAFLFRSSTLATVPLFSEPSEVTIKALAKGGPLWPKQKLTRYIADETRLIERIKPDLVVGDFRLSLAISARLTGVPYVNLSHAHWSPSLPDKRPLLPVLPLSKALPLPLAKRIFELAYPLAERWHIHDINAARRKAGLSAYASLRDAYTDGDYTLYLDPPSLIPITSLPKTHRYLGPVIWSPEMSNPQWWEDVPTDIPCVYISFGSSGPVELLPQVISTVARNHFTAMVTTAGRSNDIQADHPHVYTAPYLHGERTAKRASVVINSGGSAPVYQALRAGTPVIGIPTNMDQFFTMKFVEQYGAGVMIRADRFSEEALSCTLQTVLSDNRYQAAAARLKGELQEQRTFGNFKRFLTKQFGAPATYSVAPISNRGELLSL